MIRLGHTKALRSPKWPGRSASGMPGSQALPGNPPPRGSASSRLAPQVVNEWLTRIAVDADPQASVANWRDILEVRATNRLAGQIGKANYACQQPSHVGTAIRRCQARD